MTRSFPIYDELAKSQRELSRYENMTTVFVMRKLRIRETTGIEKIGSVERGLIIFVLREMAVDLHRLIVGIRRIIMLGKGIDKDGIIDFLYEYYIDYETSERLRFKDTSHNLSPGLSSSALPPRAETAPGRYPATQLRRMGA